MPKLVVIHKPGGYKGWLDDEPVSRPSWRPVIGCSIVAVIALLVSGVILALVAYNAGRDETLAALPTVVETTPELTAETTPETTAESTAETTLEATAETTANPTSAARITYFVPTASGVEQTPEVTAEYLPEIVYPTERPRPTPEPQIIERVIPGERIIVTAPPVVIPGPEILITSPPVQIVVTATLFPTATFLPTVTSTPDCLPPLPPDEGSPTPTATANPYPHCITPTATPTSSVTATLTVTATYPPTATAAATFPPDETPELTSVP